MNNKHSILQEKNRLMGKSYSIGDVSRISGVTEKQIRNWERQDYIPLPDRIVAGMEDER